MVESIEELRKICQDQQSRDENNFLFYYSRWTIQLTRFFIIAGISANQVTIISALFLFLSFVPFLFGYNWGLFSYNRGYILLSALLFNISYFLDHVDGELARYYGSTYYGRLLDVIVHDITYFVFIFVGAGLFFRNNNLIFLVLGFSASLFIMLQRLHELRFEYLTLKLKVEAGVLKHKNFARLAYKLSLAHMFLPPLYVIALLNISEGFIILYGIYMPIYWVYWLFRKKGWGGKDQHLDTEKELWVRLRDHA